MGRSIIQRSSTVGNFLAAQEESPTLTLAHAGLNDDSALEIAHFLAGSRHLTRLDLTGNNISSTGVHHLSKALKQNFLLRSLTLKHNQIGDLSDDLNAAGLTSLCRVLEDNETLRHLDLRHAGLQGIAAANIIGQMLRKNRYLTHLELSWNPLSPAGGQVLLEQLQANTTLFDCQLTGCGISDETLLGIAEILHRNRKGKGADLQAGPYQAVMDSQAPAGAMAVGLGGPWAESQFVECIGGDRSIAEAGVPGDGGDEDIIARADKATFSKFIVSSETTNEMMMRLAKFMQSPSTTSKDAALAQEMYDYLDKAQKQLICDRDGIEGIHRHLTAVSESFRDRELRSRDRLAVGQDELMELNKEIISIRGILERRSQDLALIREQNSQMQRDRMDDERQAREEEVMNKSKIAEIMVKKRELEKRLASLEDLSQKQEADNIEFRKRADRLRQGVTLLHLPGRAGPLLSERADTAM
jgi:hypothetical protein